MAAKVHCWRHQRHVRSGACSSSAAACFVTPHVRAKLRELSFSLCTSSTCSTTPHSSVYGSYLAAVAVATGATPSEGRARRAQMRAALLRLCPIPPSPRHLPAGPRVKGRQVLQRVVVPTPLPARDGGGQELAPVLRAADVEGHGRLPRQAVHGPERGGHLLGRGRAGVVAEDGPGGPDAGHGIPRRVEVQGPAGRLGGEEVLGPGGGRKGGGKGRRQLLWPHDGRHTLAGGGRAPSSPTSCLSSSAGGGRRGRPPCAWRCPPRPLGYGGGRTTRCRRAVAVGRAPALRGSRRRRTCGGGSSSSGGGGRLTRRA